MQLRETLYKHKNNYKQVTSVATPEDALLTTSFVVPVYNSAATISSCVQSIISQQRADLIKEIILINDGSTDDSLSELQHIAARNSRVKIIIEDNGVRKYAARTRNKGIERATADLVCFVDSDIILPSDYMYQHIIQHQTDSKCITFSLRSNVAAAELATFPVDLIEGDFRNELLRDKSSLQGVMFSFCDTHTIAELCLTCAVTYRRSDLVKVRGCPENFIGWGFNDTAMAAKVMSLGRSVVPVYGTTVAHIEHSPRSGNSSAKWSEFTKNKRRYNLMLDLAAEDTFKYHLETLEI